MNLKSFIKNRKVIISYLICDSIIFFLVFYKFQFFQKILFLIFFFLVSYVIGKYDLIFPHKFGLAKNFFFRYLYLSLFNIIFYFFVYSFSKTEADIIFISTLYLKLSFLSIFFQLLILKLYFKKNTDCENWATLIENSTKKELDKYVTRYNEINIQRIKLINLNKTRIKDIRKITGIIFEEKTLENKKSHLDILKKNKNLIQFNKLSWCNDYLEFLPISLLNENHIKKYSSRINKFRIYSHVKKFGDLFISILLIFLTFPLMLLVSILIKIEDGGPIFYTQKRTGYNLKIFKIYKFRSMKVDAEKSGIQWSTRSDSRITNVGKIIRLMRIDELPQLITVLKGEMSLIGPRPERPEINKHLFEVSEFFRYRYLLKPGLSGWAQVNYNYAASEEESINKLGFDMYYLKNNSFLLDLLIIFKTIKLVFNLKGALPN